MEHESASPRRSGVVAVVARASRLLVIRRSALVVAPGAFCFPGGGIEQGESEPQALIRELREELSVVVVPERRIWESETATGVRLAWWSAQVPEDQEFRANPAEVASVHWFTPEELGRLDGLLDSNRRFLATWRAGAFDLSGVAE